MGRIGLSNGLDWSFLCIQAAELSDMIIKRENESKKIITGLNG
jgi:hypothetical protein